MNRILAPTIRVRILLAFVAAAGSGGCATLSLGSPSAAEEQVTAALRDLSESTASALLLDAGRIRIASDTGPDGSPQLAEDGNHSRRWLDHVMELGLADGMCNQSDGCTPGANATVVSLSRPAEGARSVFVDAQIRGVQQSQHGTTRFTRIVRMQLSDESGQWRVVAVTPLWESNS